MGVGERVSRKSRRSDPNSFTLLKPMLLLLGGGSALGALLAIGGFVQLDSVLVISKTIFNLITGIKQIGAGVALLLLGLVQALGLMVLSLAAIVSVLAVASGLLRLLAQALPGLGTVWNLMGRVLNGIVGLLGFPQPLEGPPQRAVRSPVPLTVARRVRPVVRAAG